MIAIIGGSGFIGSSFAKLCIEAAVSNVVIIDKSPGTENVACTVVADIREPTEPSKRSARRRDCCSSGG